MKKFFAIASVAAIFASLTAPAHAGYSPHGIFGGRSTPDGAIDVRDNASAQGNPIRGQSVADRPRPDFEATPIDVSSFQLFPSLAVGTYHDSNIYALPGGGADDEVLKVNPELSLVSNWGRHALNFTGIGDFNMYSDNDSEDNNNGAMQVDGRFDVARGMWLAGKAGWQRATEPRSSPSNPGAAAEPQQFDQTTGSLTAFRGAGLLSAYANYNVKNYDYIDPQAIGGGKVDTSDRDRMEHDVTGKLAYEVSGNLKPYVKANYDVRNYDNNVARDSDGYALDLGANMDFGGIVTADAYVGYLTHDYDNVNNGGDINTMDFGADVLWNITTLTSLEAELSRTIEETTIASAGYISTGSSLTLTHELMRDLIVEGHADFTHNNYQISGARVDEVRGAGVGGRYFITRQLYADATFDWSERGSTAQVANYDKHIAFLRVGAHY